MNPETTRLIEQLRQAFERGILDEESYRSALATLTGSPSYRATLRGSGAIAQGPGAVAAGEGGVAVGGDVHGGIHLGGGGASSRSRAQPAADPAADLAAQLQVRKTLLDALQREAILASGGERARLMVQVELEQVEVRELERRLDALGKGDAV